MKKYNVIENGDYTLGKAKDIVEYLKDCKKNLLNTKENVDFDVEFEMSQIDKVILDILNEQYQSWVILKVYRNEFDELTFEDLNI